MHRLRAAGQPGLGLQDDPRRAAHGLGAARQVQVALAEPQRPRGLVHRLEPRRAEPVDGDAGDLDRQAREERRHARGVAVVLARLVRRAEVDVADGRRVDAGALDRGADRVGGEVVGAHAGEGRRGSAPSACERRRRRKRLRWWIEGPWTSFS